MKSNRRRGDAEDEKYGERDEEQMHAAKKWRFPPPISASPRLLFDFIPAWFGPWPEENATEPYKGLVPFRGPKG